MKRWRNCLKQLPSDYDAVGRYFFYQKAYSFKEVSDTSPLVAQIVSGERERLRKFVAALRGTLHVLSAVAALRKDKPAPENMIEFLRTLQSVLTGTTGVEELR